MERRPERSHVHHVTARRGRCPAFPLRPRHEYAADFPRGLPAGDFIGQRSRLTTRWVCAAPRPISARLEPVYLLRGVYTLVPHVHLPVSLAGPGRLAVPTRPAVVRAAPPSPASPGSGCPQLHRPAATGGDGVLSSPSGNTWRLVAHEIADRSPGRTAPMLPMQPFVPEKRTHDYVRHGTTTLFAALDIATGQVTGLCQPRHRHQEFLRFLKQVAKAYPTQELHLVMDNYAATSGSRSRPGWPRTRGSTFTSRLPPRPG